MDMDRIRAETPGAEKVIHLNNCGAGLMPQPVLDAVIAHLRLEAEIGGYEAEDAAAAALDNTYGALGKLLNCGLDELAVVENATVAWDMAFYGLPMGPGDVVLTAVSEYASNYIAYLQRAARDGIEIRVVPNDNTGQTDAAALANMIDDRVKLISITHVPTNGGLINPAAAIGKVARDAGVPYLLDACQSAGQIPLDVAAIGCDMLSATGRKFLRGPRGTGFLYVRDSMLERLDPPFLDLHAAAWTAPEQYEMLPNARRFENWENYVAGKVGLGVAVDYALEIGLDAIAQRVQGLADGLRQRMAALPGITVQDLGAEKSGIISFSVADRSAEQVAGTFAAANINISTSSAQSTQQDMHHRGIAMMNRMGLHYYNTETELDRFMDCLEAI
ncbi:MAG: aminotransferase class V-fold PLP-dependent enzyme [Rhodospirillaceae bacterium]|jgi:cysteine desulfurase / selenocysteine lyase|nr:aminotransferase class V-fold PLP-dependent enzyme [Rhodospirillaceae bacterium]MBT3493007.1 aminotransferase class V-fold PLP-dependent enzyme [Rhodospirillaceae bacterium]MBT3977785.1 aminotransferase class V-fold PLP-dependent enzyme [Rhodospirillaceae bacterium]MBT4562917.1 aminotransferase class V-fold PLP-dependent enzyme [Rhodospirillaceae bacterium]MBT4742542.1 aminotransferase class V-fold PLP-dependent enzyme [Rhodospirillaceae bacterium]